jgi:RNA polymerase sigma factor (sigma-70 family)
MTRTGRPDLIACFQAHYDDLLRFIGRRVATADRARELAQDTYLRVAAVPAGAEILDARAYLFRIAANLVIDSARRDMRRAARTVPDAALEALADPAPGAERAVGARERLALMERALAELPANPRTALVLHRLDGMTHAAIAARLRVSESMVAKYIAQALRHCRDRLRALDPEE